MILGLRHVGIVVTDLEASLRFYRDLLGFREVSRAEERGDHIDNMLDIEGADVTTVKLEIPFGGMIELLSFHEHHRDEEFRELCEIGISHIALTVDDLDATVDLLRLNRVPFHSAPQLSGSVKVAFCRDPDANAIELVQLLN